MATQLMRLEDRCLVHLSCHLEEYSLEALASLPLHLRRRLLLILPVVDICQLEDTAVTEGIDMEESIWKEVQELLSKLSRSVSCFKENFFDQILHEVFRGKVIRAGDHLFSVHGPLRGFFPPVNFPYRSGTPPRHVKSSTREFLVMQLLSALINPCKFFPKVVSIHCNELARTDMWTRRNVVLQNLLSTLMCEVKSLWFSVNDEDTECYSIPRNILELVFSQPDSNLTSLSLFGGAEFLLQAVVDAEVFFAEAHFTQDQVFLQSLYPQLLSCSLPYSRLVSLNIRGYGDLLPEQQHVYLDKLNSIVLCQSALESVDVAFFSSSPNANAFKLYTTLGRLFYQPQFRALSVEYAEVDWKDLGALFLPFLTSPISPDRQQELFFQTDIFVVDGPPPPVAADFNVASVLPGKELSFSNVLYRGNPQAFLQWLTELNILSSLSSFGFSNDDQGYQPPEVVGTAMSLLKDESSAALLESFSISWAPLTLDFSPEVPFNYLFGGLRLRKVSLCNCAIYENSLLPILTQGLLKQVPLGVLESLLPPSLLCDLQN